MTPQNLRQRNKYEDMIDLLLVIATPEERTRIVVLHDYLQSEAAVTAIRGLVNGTSDGAATVALEYINWAFNRTPRPAWAHSVSDSEALGV